MYENGLVVHIAAKSSVSIAPPAFTTQPANQSAVAGASATFSPVATFNGSGSIPNPTSFFWYFDDPVFGPTMLGPGSKYTLGAGQANPCNLTINNVSASDVGTYFLEVVNGGGLAISQTATLAWATSSPTFTVQPSSQTIASGTTGRRLPRTSGT